MTLDVCDQLPANWLDLARLSLPALSMAKSRAKKGTKKKSSTRRAPRKDSSSRKSSGRGNQSVQDAPLIPASGLPADIDLLNAHRYPDSMPASFVKQVRASKICQRRLEEILKDLPGGKRGGARGFNQLFEEKRQDEIATDNAELSAGAEVADSQADAVDDRPAGTSGQPGNRPKPARPLSLGEKLRNFFK